MGQLYAAKRRGCGKVDSARLMSRRGAKRAKDHDFPGRDPWFPEFLGEFCEARKVSTLGRLPRPRDLVDWARRGSRNSISTPVEPRPCKYETWPGQTRRYFNYEVLGRATASSGMFLTRVTLRVICDIKAGVAGAGLMLNLVI